MTGKTIQEMIRFFGGDKKRIAHALKVYACAGTIAELENCTAEVKKTVILAAILHDVGIKVAEEKYGSCTMPQQEEEGPPVAREILLRLGNDPALTDRVCFLIAHHHHPGAAEDQDFRILLEADFIVNFEEENLPLCFLEQTAKEHFRTQSGLSLLRAIFL
ncbi:MAG: HD domain-containing protein [Treponema sp.]|jgi:HD superfamily phosphodiesterase|nr:HD domain-containing protein [Treponema sp.]